MRVLHKSMIGIGPALVASLALAGQLEDAQEVFNQMVVYGVLLLSALFAVVIYFTRVPMDKRETPLRIVLDGRHATYSVASDVMVRDCTRKMTDKRIGSVLVMDGEKLVGIFTERDALNRVLAAGRDPNATRVCEVMTSNPYCLSPERTVADAMAVVTNRHFRHFPILDGGKVSAVMSSRDLIHWLVKNKIAGIEEVIELAWGHNPA